MRWSKLCNEVVKSHKWQGQRWPFIFLNLQLNRIADDKLGEVGFGEVGFDVEADGEAAEGGEGVVDADALVVGLFDFLGVDTHVAIEVVA